MSLSHAFENVLKANTLLYIPLIGIFLFSIAMSIWVQVAGNFHFAPGRSFQAGGVHVHDLIPFGTEEFDISHTIHKLSFGEDYPGRENPLNGVIVPKVNAHNREGKTGAYQYFLKVKSMTSYLFLHLLTAVLSILQTFL